jgi:hypothetical protein
VGSGQSIIEGEKIMALDTKLFLRTLSPKVMSKAMQSFDRATTVVVASCWSAALVAVIAAIYTLTLSVSAHHQTDAAMVAEPVLPRIVHKPMDIHSVQAMFDRMQHRMPEVTFQVRGQDLAVVSMNGSAFHQWISALSYLDTISPDLHWSLEEFCVGECKNSELMHAILKGERVSFEAPETAKK